MHLKPWVVLISLHLLLFDSTQIKLYLIQAMEKDVFINLYQTGTILNDILNEMWCE